MHEQDDRTADLGFARVDLDRAERTGDPEVVYGAGKTPAQLVAILSALHEKHPDRAVLATRLSDEAVTAVGDLEGARIHLSARAVTLGPLPEPRGSVVVVSAGTSDGPVAAEAVLTARVHGAGVEEIHDVGVAGLHRLLDVRDRLAAADCLVVVAGMEGALPSVVGGLTGGAAGGGADLGRVRRVVRRRRRAAGDAQLLRARGDRGQHRQRLRRRGVRRPGGPERRAPGPRPRMTVWVDASSGASGDMLLGALVGRRRTGRDPAGAPSTRWSPSRSGSTWNPCPATVSRPPAATSRWPTRPRTAPGATSAPCSARPDLAEEVRDLAEQVFERLAVAEATVHGSDPLDVAFHEVGALDAIADVVGVVRRLRGPRHRRGRGHARRGRLRRDPWRPRHHARAAPGRRRAAARRPVVRRPGRRTGDGAVHAHRGGAADHPGHGMGAAAGDDHRPDRRRRGRPRPRGRTPTCVRLFAGAPVGSPAGPPLLIETNIDDLDPRVWPAVIAALLGGRRLRRLADPDPDEEGPARRTPCRVLVASAKAAARAGGDVPADLDDRRPRAAARQARARPRDGLDRGGRRADRGQAGAARRRRWSTPSRSTTTWPRRGRTLDRPVSDVLDDAVAASRAFFAATAGLSGAPPGDSKVA